MAVQIPTQFFQSSSFAPSTTGELISSLLPNLIIGAGVMMFVLIFAGGFMMIHGAGNSDPKEAAKGKAAVSAAVIGFLLVVSAYFILQMLKVFTGVDFLNPPNL